MTPETLLALRASIRHWEENILAEDPTKINIHWTGCALCALFLNRQEETCLCCPVAEATGADVCAKTPWMNIHAHLEVWRIRPASHTFRDGFRRGAKEMLSLLQSLLPPETAP